MKFTEISKIEKIKKLIDNGNLSEAFTEVCEFMSREPDSPVPHNILGIIYDIQGEKTRAMNHFRAACALDGTYLPSRCNLYLAAGISGKGVMKFYPEECSEEQKDNYIIRYEKGVGYIEKEAKNNGK